MTTKKMIISLIVGIAVSAMGFYFAFRKVPFGELVNYLVSINYLWILPAAAAILFSFTFRVFRWQVILSSATGVSFWQAFHPLMIGFMLNCVLPGRVGEVARPVILQRRNNINFSTGLATVAAERAFDLILMMMLFSFVLATVQIDPDINIPFGKYNLNKEVFENVGKGMLKLGILLIACIILISSDKIRQVINKGIMRIPSIFFFAGSSFKEKIKDKICIKLIKIMENLALGFSMVKNPQKVFICMGLSFIIWGSAVFSYYIFIFGCPGINLSFQEMAAVMVIICFFIALPSAPGFWGLWEAGGVFAMSLFGIPAKDAAGFTLANHAIQMFPIIIVGMVSAMITGVSIWKISGQDLNARV